MNLDATIKGTNVRVGEIYYEKEVISSIIDRSYGNVHAYRMWRRL